MQRILKFILIELKYFYTELGKGQWQNQIFIFKSYFWQQCGGKIDKELIVDH